MKDPINDFNFVQSDKVGSRLSIGDICKGLSISHPSSGSLTSGTVTASDSEDESEDSDYGLYEDFEEMPSSGNTTPPLQSLSAIKQSHTNVLTKKASTTDSSRMIVYTVKNSHSHISCRSFDKTMNNSKSSSNVPVRISMTGVRIVQDSIGMHAEFFVKMSLGLEDYVGWKTLEDFKEVANACLEFSTKKKKSSWPSIFLKPINKEPRYRVSRSTRLVETVSAWEKVVLVISQRNWFGQLSVASLMAESNALEHFLESLLFEIPDADILMEFLCVD